jgi:1-deoxy-D-xylulose 5-phosphate reductoisomerase
MKRLLILGATGSIGSTAIRAIREKKLPIRVTGLVANKSAEKLSALSKEFGCPFFLTEGKSDEALFDFIKNTDSEIALNGIAGAYGLTATIKCLDACLDVALANKESIVMGGDFLLSYSKEKGRRLIPVDSEHSAIYHLIGRNKRPRKLIITASGGPFFKRENLENVTVEEAVNHPTWKMGKKISIDSATLLNKGLEVIEAGFLFGFESHSIQVTVHRQSIVHSMIQMTDGSIYAQMSPPDMTLPIISAIIEENPGSDIVKPLDFNSSLTLTFEPWLSERFPLLAAAFTVLDKKRGYPIAYNAADEVAVDAFINGKIAFTDIAKVVLSVIANDFDEEIDSFEAIMEADKKARILAREAIDDL